MSCFMIISIFIYALCQLSIVRAGRAVGRLSGKRHLKNDIDFGLWNNFSDTVEILVIHFGIEKFMRTVSPRMLCADVLKEEFFIVHFIYY